MLNKEEKLIFDSYFNKLDFNFRDDYEKVLKKFNFNSEDLNIPFDSIAVAQILNRNIQSRLPNSGIVDEYGSVTLTRNINKKNKLSPSKIAFIPRLIFSINWGDAGPGISWPEQYRITYVPDYEKYIITASSDTQDYYHGISGDIALGVSGDTIKDMKSVIIGHWNELKLEYEQEEFAKIIQEGLIDKNEINKWKKEVWS